MGRKACRKYNTYNAERIQKSKRKSKQIRSISLFFGTGFFLSYYIPLFSLFIVDRNREIIVKYFLLGKQL
jgi:hypothetical protein